MVVNLSAGRCPPIVLREFDFLANPIGVCIQYIEERVKDYRLALLFPRGNKLHADFIRL
jgi:hypothetical protein